jgi:hypothetical protein
VLARPIKTPFQPLDPGSFVALLAAVQEPDAAPAGEAPQAPPLIFAAGHVAVEKVLGHGKAKASG